MIRLDFVSCLTAAAHYCHEHSALLLPDADPDTDFPASMTEVEDQLSQWSETHPAYQIRQWSCRVVGSDEASAGEWRPYQLQDLLTGPPRDRSGTPSKSRMAGTRQAAFRVK